MSNSSTSRAAYLRSHYTVPRDRHQASSIGADFASATAARVANRGTPGANVLRAVKWAATWRLPSNRRAYEILSLKRVPQHVGALCFEPLGQYALFDKFRRSVLRTWGALVLHEPALQDSETTSWVALGMHWAFPHNPMLCLEASMHVLANVVPIRPDADVPRRVVDAVVALIETKRAALTAKWARHGIDPAEVIVPLIRNLGVPVLGESLWPSVFGACVVGDDTPISGPSLILRDKLTHNSAISAAPHVVEPCSSFLLFIAALVLIRATTAEKLSTKQRILDAHFALFQQDGGASITHGVTTAMYRTVRDLLPVMVMNGPALPRRQMVMLGGSAATTTSSTNQGAQNQGGGEEEQPDYYPPLLNPADEPDRKMIVSVPDFLENIERGEMELAKKGVSRTQAVLNTAEAMGWTRALAIQQTDEVRVLEAELARRDAARRRSAVAPAGGKLNLQHGSSSFVQQQVQQQLQPTFDTRYASPSTFTSAAAATDATRADIERLYQHHRSFSDAGAAPSTTSPRRAPFIVVPGNSAMYNHNTASRSGRGFLLSSMSTKTATIIKTELPTSALHRCSATRPQSSVAALLKIPNATYGAYPYQQQQQQSGVLLSPSSSSSHPSGVVTSPKRGVNSPSRAAAMTVVRASSAATASGSATTQRRTPIVGMATPQTAIAAARRSASTAAGLSTRPHVHVDPAAASSGLRKPAHFF